VSNERDIHEHSESGTDSFIQKDMVYRFYFALRNQSGHYFKVPGYDGRQWPAFFPANFGFRKLLFTFGSLDFLGNGNCRIQQIPTKGGTECIFVFCRYGRQLLCLYRGGSRLFSEVLYDDLGIPDFPFSDNGRNLLVCKRGQHCFNHHFIRDPYGDGKPDFCVRILVLGFDKPVGIAALDCYDIGFISIPPSNCEGNRYRNVSILDCWKPDPFALLNCRRLICFFQCQFDSKPDNDGTGNPFNEMFGNGFFHQCADMMD